MFGRREHVNGNTYLNKKEIRKYKWISEITEDKSLTDYVLLRSVLKERLLVLMKYNIWWPNLN